MTVPQQFRPIFQDVYDTVVRADAPWIEESPTNAIKVLWVGKETGHWASLYKWKKGHVAGPHKHLSGAHTYIVSGKLRVRDGVLDAGDYTYEPNGVIHEETTALEDTVFLYVSQGPLLFFNEDGSVGYLNSEVFEKMQNNQGLGMDTTAAGLITEAASD